jgi:hypothetical protein
MREKVLAVLLAGAMVLSMSACGSKGEPTSTSGITQEAVQESSGTLKATENAGTLQAAKSTEAAATETAPYHPTQRTMRITPKYGTTKEVQETLSYDSAGGYVVSAKVDTISDFLGTVSFDYAYTVNKAGELTNYNITLYSYATPDGLNYTVDMIKGYPTKTSVSGTNAGFDIADCNYSEEGKLVADDSGNISICDVYNYTPYIYINAAYGGINGSVTKTYLKKDIDNFSTENKGNQIYLTATHNVETYNATSRSKETVPRYDCIDVITYNSIGLVESIETYKDVDSVKSIDTLSDTKNLKANASYSVYYTYDSQGNVTHVSTGDIEIDYIYGNGGSSTTAASSSSTTSTKSVTGK